MHKRRNYLSWDVSKQEALEKSVREFQRTRVQKKQKQKKRTFLNHEQGLRPFYFDYL